MDNTIEEKLVGFFEKYRLLKYKKGEIIFRPGNGFTQASFVKSGYVRLFMETKNGKEITINLFKPVFYLSLMYCANKNESSYFFEAVTDVELWTAPYDKVKQFIKEDPEIVEWLNIKLLKTLNEVLDNVNETIAGDSYTKIVSIFLSLANKFGVKNTDGVMIDFQTSHRIIASLAGITRETASLQIKRMENEGFIKQVNRRIIIPNMKKLQEISSF